LLGATPWRQQVAQIIGIAASACVIGFVLILLNEAWGFGSKDLLAPQATLMKMIVEGVFNAQLPWVLIIFGVILSIMLEILQIPILPVAIGLYLPIHLSTPIMVGGLVRGILDNALKKKPEEQEARTETGILYSSGLIAGEALMGLVLALLAYFDVSTALAEGAVMPSWASLVMFALVTCTLVYYAGAFLGPPIR